jgi:hypothetical protein
MRAKCCLLLFVLLTLLITASPAFAQDANWFVWLYNVVTKELVRVNADGSQGGVYSLGLAENTFISSEGMAFTRDGSRLAYCYQNNLLTTLVLRDIVAQRNLFEIDLGKAVSCLTGVAAFNMEETQVTVGVLRHIPPDSFMAPSGMDTSGPAWELLVYDAASGSLLHGMNATTPAATITGEFSGGAFMPQVRDFANNQIIFAEWSWGLNALAIMPAYRWNLTDDSLEVVTPYGNPGVDRAGETMIWIEDDTNLPSSAGIEPTGLSKTLMFADGSGEAPRIIFYGRDRVILDARFIDNGQRIALYLSSGSETEGASNKWVLLDRTGMVTDLLSTTTFSQMRAAPDGYVFFNLNFSNMDEFSDPNYTMSYGTTLMWQSPPNEPSPMWELAWVTPSPAGENLPPFPAFPL